MRAERPYGRFRFRALPLWEEGRERQDFRQPQAKVRIQAMKALPLQLLFDLKAVQLDQARRQQQEARASLRGFRASWLRAALRAGVFPEASLLPPALSGRMPAGSAGQALRDLCGKWTRNPAGIPGLGERAYPHGAR